MPVCLRRVSASFFTGYTYALINQYDEKLRKEENAANRAALREQANREIAGMLKKETADTLDKVLFELSNQMKNAYSRSDA